VSLGRPTATLETDVSRLWNSLPAGLRQTDIGYEQFKWLLKIFLALRSRRFVTMCLNCACRNFLSYLLSQLLYKYEICFIMSSIL